MPQPEEAAWAWASKVPEAPPWDRGPRCPAKDCGGPAIPVAVHHLEAVRKAGEAQPCPKCPHQHAGPEMASICIGCPCPERPPAPALLACARCGEAWRSPAAEVDAAVLANEAWKASAVGATPRRTPAPSATVTPSAPRTTSPGTPGP